MEGHLVFYPGSAMCTARDVAENTIKYLWGDRAEAYDELLDEERREAAADERRARQEKLRQLANEGLSRIQKVARMLDSATEKVGSSPLGAITQTTHDRINGT